MIESRFRDDASALSDCTKQSLEWVAEHSDVRARLDAAFSGFEEERFAIPYVLDGSYGFIPPWHYLLHEAEQELHSGSTLILAGMYKESFRSLRSFIELNLMGLYYFTNRDMASFRQWLSGDKETPTRAFLVQHLIKNNPRIALFEKQTAWSKRVREFYKSLSKFVHTQGASGSFRSLRSSNMIVFSEQGMELSIDSLIDSTEDIPTAERLFEEFVVANSPNVELIGRDWNQIMKELAEWQDFGRAVEKEGSEAYITTRGD